jgi:hypothetical protein
MNVEIAPCTEFRNYASEWDKLVNRWYRVPILSAKFVESCIEYFASDDVMIGAAVDNGNVAAFIFLKPHKLGTLQTWEPSQAPLGLFVFDPDWPLNDFFGALFSQFRARFMIGVTQQDPLFVNASKFPDTAEPIPYIDTPWIDCETSFDSYWQSLGKNIKRNTRKDLNKLKAQEISPRLEIITKPELVAEAIRMYGLLETGGWKGNENSAVAADNKQGQFYRSILEKFCRDGNGYIFQYFYGDELAASDFGIANDQCIVILKTTYRQTSRDTSPAQLLRYAYFPYLFERFSGGRIEFYGRAIDWHARWTRQTRRLYHINVYRYTAVRSFVTMGRWLKGRATTSNAILK